MSEQLWTTIVIAVSGIITASISAFALIQTKQTHTLINSRMTELLAAAKLLARAEGVAEGEQTERDRAAEPSS